MRINKLLTVLFIFSLSLHTFAGEVISYHVPGIVCQDCIDTITKHLVKRKKIPREKIEFNLDKKIVKIDFDKNNELSKEDLKYLLIEAGYELKKITK